VIAAMSLAEAVTGSSSPRFHPLRNQALRVSTTTSPRCASLLPLLAQGDTLVREIRHLVLCR